MQKKYTHDPMQYARSEHKLYPAVYKPAKRDIYLTLILIGLFLLSTLVKG